MKNFMQFIIPIIILCVVGYLIFMNNRAYDDTKKLYITCNNKTENFEIYSGLDLEFSDKENPCYLKINISNVDRTYLKINTPYLWRLDDRGNIDEIEPKNINYVEIDQEEILYSYDKKTKFIFEYK